MCRLPLFWKFQIIGWLVYALLTFPLKALLFESFSYAILVTVFRESFGFLITSALRSVYLKLGLSTDRPVWLAIIVLCIAFSCSGLDTLIGLGIEQLGGRTENQDPTFGLFAFRALLFSVWSVLYFTIRDLIAARKRLEKLHEAEKAARDAEILMLRAQVSPHFLFNAFNTILAELDERNREMVPVVRGLSDYFRYSLANHDEVFVTMGQEYDAILSYLTVEKARFRDTLIIDCQLDPDFREMKVPGIFLQPLIENALKYGHKTSPTPLILRLNIAPATGGGALVEVSNSGKWIEPSGESNRKRTGGQGLSVLRRRLNLLYPGEHSIEILHPKEEEKVTIRIHLPFELQTLPNHVR
ncbi:MAG: sensor histidine kinase [Luteolibacter sp.]